MHPSTSEPKTASDILIEAFEGGRPIIPFLGAGISVNSGFPPMAAITEYLAKVRFYIRNIIKSSPLPDAEHLRRHGWPGFSELNAEIWRYLTASTSKEARDAVLEPFLQKLTALPQTATDKGGFATRFVRVDKDIDRDRFNDLLKQQFNEATRWDENRNSRIRLVVQSQFWDLLSDNESAAAQQLWPTFLHPNSQGLRGDWYDLMMSLTDGDFDLVDSLFHVLGHNRRPAGDHVFLALLADTFRIRLYLSLNFDPLLETALWNEGHSPNVIEVAKDSDLPSPEAIRDRLTVLKLHGGAYGLRIGERIQVTADPTTQTRAMRLIPKDALILVMGFSGYERRMTQLLVEHCRRQPMQTQLLWMNFGEQIDKPLKKIMDEFERYPDGQRPISVRNYHGMSLLLNALIRARGSHPAGHQSYSVLPTGPWAEPLPFDARKPLIAFFRNEDWIEQPANEKVSGHCGASVRMADFCASRARTHHVIWIDCEQHHTVDGVVTEILDAVYQYDPAFQPLLMQSVDNQSNPHYRSIERIREALQRGKYVLAIDSPETIGRPQTVHHGTPTLKLPDSQDSQDNFSRRLDKFTKRVSGFFNFLTTLMTKEARPDSDPESSGHQAADIGESFICVAFAPPSPRRSREEAAATLSVVGTLVAQFREALQNMGTLVQLNDNGPQPAEVSEPRIDYHSIIVSLFTPQSTCTLENSRILTFFRRPRSHLAYQTLLRWPLSRPGDAHPILCPEAWNELYGVGQKGEQSDGPFAYNNNDQTQAIRLPGGQLWLPRLTRNRHYFLITEPGQRAAKELWKGKGLNANEIATAILSLLTTAIVHRRAARYYFSDVYEATGDMAAFREYIYHRVSYLRTLCRFLGVSKHGATIPGKDEWSTRKLVAWAIGHYRNPDENPWKALPETPASAPTWNDIRMEVRRAWREELGAFHATLSREFGTVLQNLYAGTWIRFADHILEIDVHEMFIEDFFGIDDRDPEIELCKEDIGYLKEELHAQVRKARFEMADWSGLLATRGTDAEESVNKEHPLYTDVFGKSGSEPRCEHDALTSDYVNRVISKRKKRMPADFVECFIRLLDLTADWLGRAEIYHELTRPGDVHDEAAQQQMLFLIKAEKVLVRLDMWIKAIDREGVSIGNDGKMPPFSHEIKQHLRDRLAKHQLGVLAARARFGFNRLNAIDESAAPNPEVRDDAIRLFERTRRTVFHDGVTYNQLRAKSLRMVSRCDYLHPLQDVTRRFSKPIADLNLALRLLHGHGAADVLEVMSCYRTKAEAYMLWAKEIIASDGSNGAARNRLRSARSAIDRAGEAFHKRRRNVPWWLRLCQIRAQWAVLSCMLRLREPRDDRDLAFEADLRYGLDAIRAGFDGLLPVDEILLPVDESDVQLVSDVTLIRKSTTWQWSRFAKLWLDLAKITEDGARSNVEFLKRWESANRAARLPRLWKCWMSRREREMSRRERERKQEVQSLFNEFWKNEPRVHANAVLSD